MPDDVPKEEKGKSKGVSAYFPNEYYERMIGVVKREGYMNISDFLRDASRKLVQFYETRYYSQVLTFLLNSGKITSQDLHEAIQYVMLRDEE